MTRYALYVPLESDGMSRVLFEYMAAGRPIVASRVGVAAEVIDVLSDRASVDEDVEVPDHLPDDEHWLFPRSLVGPEPPRDVERRARPVGDEVTDPLESVGMEREPLGDLASTLAAHFGKDILRKQGGDRFREGTAARSAKDRVDTLHLLVETQRRVISPGVGELEPAVGQRRRRGELGHQAVERRDRGLVRHDIYP